MMPSTVSSIAALRTLDKTTISHAFATGYYAAGDGGGGAYYLDAADTTSADNGGTLIVAADGGRWKLIHEGRISVKQFGAKVDGATADQTFVQAAINANSVNHVLFPPGVCKITSTLRLRSNLLVELAPDAVIDFSGAAVGDTLFAADGAPDVFVPLTERGVLGTRTLGVESTQGFYVGDWIKIRAETIFDSHRTSSRIGEINRIAEGWRTVVGDELTATSIPLVADLQDTFKTEEAAAVAKLTLVENVTIRGGKLQGDPADQNTENGQTAISFNYSLNCRVENVTIEQFDARGVLSRNSINTTVTGCRFANARATATGYGVSFMDATADSVASHNHFDEVRHSLSTNNSPSTDHGIVRRILFSNNTVRSSARALQEDLEKAEPGGDAIDTHAAAEDISIIGNTVLGSSGLGINVECPTAIVIGNTINDAHSHGISAHNEADHNGSVVIANNRVERCAETGIVVRQGRRNEFTYTEIVIEGNTVEFAGVGSSIELEGVDPGEPSGGGIIVRARDSSFVHRAVSITGNSVRDTRGDGILVSGVRCGSITGNSLSNVGGVVQSKKRFGIIALDIRSVSIGNNSMQLRTDSSSGILLKVNPGGVTRDCAVVGNTITVTTGILDEPGIKLTNDVTHTAVVANVLRGTEGVELGSGAGNIQANNV